MERRDFLKSLPAVGFVIRNGIVDKTESVHSAIRLEPGNYIFLINGEEMNIESFCEANFGPGVGGVVFSVLDVENALRVIKL